MATPCLPTELWVKIYNMKQKMEYDDRWGWGDAIANSITAPYHDRITGDHDRWWVGKHRWTWGVFEVWPDLDRATYIYHIMYGYDYYDHVHHPQHYDTRWTLMDEIGRGLRHRARPC